MNSTSSRREFLQQPTQSSLILDATAALGGVQAFGADQPAKLRLGNIGFGHSIRIAGIGRSGCFATTATPSMGPRAT